jgi:hypothetical protein
LPFILQVWIAVIAVFVISFLFHISKFSNRNSASLSQYTLCYYICMSPLRTKGDILLSPPTLVGRHIVFVLSVTQFVSATPLKLLSRISWNLVGSKDIICSCAYYQEILISWILWELCPFEIRKFPKFTTEAACQHNSSETTEQNFMKLGR